MNLASMIIRRLGISIATMLLVSACVSQELKTTIPFEPSEVSYINESGSGSIIGKTFRRRQGGGGAVSCRSQQVFLIPAGTFVRQRIAQLFGSESGGIRSSWSFAKDEGLSRYLSLSKRTKPDAAGNFEFPNLADGDYYVVACERWTIGYSVDGVCGARLVRLRGGGIENVLID